MPSHAAKKGGGRKGTAIMIVVLFLVGAAIMLYPAYSYLYNEYKNARTAAEYQEAVDASDENELAEVMAAAKAYNKSHRVNVISDPFGEEGDAATIDEEYDALLRKPGDEVMAYLDIPKIGQQLPVYHGSSNKVLEKGIGHLRGTSLPVGGKSTHSVVSGHRGLPSSKLFTDLDQLEVGDKFFFHVLGENLAYQVEKIQVVEPKQIDALAIQPDRDLATLVTCTPYGVNTHRMLITGHRVPYEEPEDETGALSWFAAFSPQTLALAGGLSLVVIVGLVVLVRRLKRRDR